jgi:mannose-6-phosphate isomerase-like protein (cupin superfamily)
MICRASEMKVEVREAMRGGEGAVTIRHYVPEDAFTAGVRLCSQLVLPPGASIGMHRHEQEDEVYILTKGSGVLDDGTVRTRIERGDAVLTGKGESHAICNDGVETLELTAVIIRYAPSAGGVVGQ